MSIRSASAAKRILPFIILPLAGCAPSGMATTAGGGPPAAGTRTSLPIDLVESTPAPTSTATPTFSPTPSIVAEAVSAGRRHTCILTESGTVKCWGENEDGQLGDGTTQRTSTPVDALGLAGVTELAAGFSHTCARTAEGELYCWGNNAFGELGDGTQTSRNSPVRVNLPISATHVSAGMLHSCATDGFDIYCWGVVEYQWMQGEEVMGITLAPENIYAGNIPYSSRITQIGSGMMHDCVLTSDGEVYCWGRNDLGQLGQEWNSFSSNVPLRVDGLKEPVKSLAVGGYHTCVLQSDGTVACWGYNRYGQTGFSYAYADAVTVPEEVPGVQSAAALSAGTYHTCAIVSGGTVECWGDNRYRQVFPLKMPFGQLGIFPGNYRAVAAGGAHSCALTAGGAVQCWGNNKYGQLGEGAAVSLPEPTAEPTRGETKASPTSTPSPTPEPANRAASLAAGRSHSCAVTSAGGVRCWGKNEQGELGNGTFTDSSIPVDVIGLSSGAAEVVTGWGHTCALTTNGGVKCWGYNKNGELGNGANDNLNRPVDVRGLSGGVIALEAGDDHTCALLSGGQVKCWGFNEYGQLGDGTAENRNTPVEVAGLYGAVQTLAAGWGHTCALTAAGGVKCWGNNHYGQLGIEAEKENIHEPVNVSGLSYSVKAISADGGQTCVITDQSLVMCWGNNKYGQLGDGTAEVRKLPVVVAGLTLKPAAIGVGWNHTCVVDAGGEMACWGWNYYGQLGNGMRTTSTVPVRANAMMGGVAQIALGWGHMCVITDTGGVQCWGLNEFGQVGDGSTADSYLPMDVLGLSGG
jgi:alpha-tubulin suppressor-like RCC1 family protein